MKLAVYLEKAERALASAQLLFSARDTEGACNRAYYAMFDAAHAALLWVGHDDNPALTRTHRGLIAAFGLHLVKTGKLDAALGKQLNQVERIRLLADYTGDQITEEQADWAVRQAVQFVQVIRELLESCHE